MVAILVEQSKETSAILVDQNNPRELNSIFTQIIRFVSRPLVKWVKIVSSGGLNLLAYPLCRLETSQRSLMAAQDEHKALSDLNEMLRRHNDNLKSQHDW